MDLFTRGQPIQEQKQKCEKQTREEDIAESWNENPKMTWVCSDYKNQLSYLKKTIQDVTEKLEPCL